MTMEHPEMDMYAYERFLADGKTPFCGVDEAGRGPLAGPVCAAAVLLPEGLVIPGLNDSKKLTAKKRDALYDIICESAVAFGIAFATVEEIEALNIKGATYLAMNRAIADMEPVPVLALVDGNDKNELDIPAIKVVKGDSLCASIAAASVLAKVTRDRYMDDMDALYPQYGFEAHKGYGTAQHRAMLEKYGPCPIHRLSFLNPKRKSEGLRGRGNLAEEAACGYLEGAGYKILSRNYSVPGGEIDIVAEESGITVFAEVKYRSGYIAGSGAESVTPRKQACLRRAAQAYLAENNITGRARFDVLELSGPSSFYDIRHIKNAFE